MLFNTLKYGKYIVNQMSLVKKSTIKYDKYV